MSSPQNPIPQTSGRLRLGRLGRRAGWLLGLPGLAVIGLAAGHFASERVAAGLRQAASEIVRGTGEGQPEPWLRVAVQGRDLVADGEAPEAAQREAALAALSHLAGHRRLIDRTGLVEEVSPFVWTVERPATNRLEAAGSRPAEIGAFELSQRLKPALPRDAVLDDRARAARGAPPDFPDAAAFAVERLQDLTTGAVASVNDTVISIRGEAASVAAYDALRSALANPPQGYSLGTVEILPPLVADIRLTVGRRPDGSLELAGHVASEAARAEIRAAAAEAAEGGAVDDRMQEARGLPAGLDEVVLARFMLKLAGLLHEGSVAFERGGVSVTGNALDPPAIPEIEGLMREGRPAGASAGRLTLTAEPVVPYVLRIRRSPDSVALSGHLPDPAAREALLARLRPRFFREAILDRTRLAPGAPEGFGAALAAAVDPLSTLSGGEATLSGTGLRLSGTSLYPQSAARLSETLPRALPPGWSAEVAVSAGETAERVAPAECVRRLAERVAGHPLRFAPGSAALAPDFYPVLDAVAALARDCPAERIEVVGHLDPPGAKPEASADPVAAEAAKETAPKPKPAPKKADRKDDKGKAKGEAKSEAKSEPKVAEKKDAKAEEAPPEKGESARADAGADLARARALAVIDYLQKAGVPVERVASPAGLAPLSDRQGVGLSLRS